MTIYTVLPKDDENLNVIVTEVATDQVVVVDTATGVTVTDNDTVKLDITPALIPPYGGFPVESVNAKTGAVILNTDDIDETASPTHKWFTEALARGSISATGDIDYNNSTGVISFNATGNLVVSVNGESGTVILDTDDIAEGNAKYYSSTLFNTDLATKTTNNLTEGGSNLYYTNNRVQTVVTNNTEQFIKADSTDTLTNKAGDISQWTNDVGYLTTEFDNQLLSFSTPNLTISSGNTVDISGLANSLDTDDITEGSTNLYYTDARARNSISVTNASGDGSLAYNAASGTITYTGPSAAEVHAHFSATNAGGDGSLAYANGVFTYTGPSSAEVWAHFTGGTGVTFNNTNGDISIGQPVATTDDVEFNTVTGNLTGNVTGNVTGDLTGDVTGQVSDISNHSTTDLTEGTNLYYTDARVDADINDQVTKAFVDALGIQATSVDPNSVALGTDTTGNYVATVSGTTNEIEVTGSGTESSAVTVGLPTDVTVANDLTVGNDTTITNDLSVGNDVTVTNDITVTNDLTVGGDVGITGDLTVSGTTTTVATENLLIKDNLFVLNKDASGTPTKDSGMIVKRGNQDNAALIWDEAGTSGKFKLGTTTSDGTQSTISVTKGTLIADIEGDITGDVTGTVTSLSNHDTDDLSEGSTNLYYTTTRANTDFDTRLATKSTTNLSEGTNLYYTAARDTAQFNTDLATKSTTNLSEGTNLYYTAARDTAQFNTDLATKDTDDLTEGSNLYYTAVRDTAQFNTDLATKDTGDLTEGTNLYYTDGRADARVNLQTGANLDLSSKDTDDLTQGTTNKYYASSLFDTDLATKSTTNLTEGTNLYYTDARADARVDLETGANLDLSFADTDDLAEGPTNLYYTDARSRAAINASGSLSYNSSTGAITYTQGNTDTVAEGSTNQYFTQARARTSISASGDISYNDSTGVISFTASTAPVTSVNGATGAVSLALADLNNVNSATPTDGQVLTWDNTNSYWKPAPTGTGTGSVTSVDSGTGLTGGPITSSGTLNVDVGTTANKIVQLDSSSRLPAVDGSLLTGLPAGYDNADVDAHLNTTSASAYEWLRWDGSDYIWEPSPTSITDMRIIDPVMQDIYGDNNYDTYSGDTLRFHTNYTGWNFGPTGPAENWNTSYRTKLWQQPGGPGNGWISVYQLATDNDKNFFRINTKNEGTSVTAGSFVTGTKYKITSLGNTTQAQWEAAGLSSTLTAAVHIVFTATGAGTGTGTADTWDTGEHTVDFTVKGGDAIGFDNDGSLVIGVDYEIYTLGDTDWNSAAGTTGVTYAVGDEFTAANNGGSGTGVALDIRPFAGTVNSFAAYTSTSSTPHPTNLELQANRVTFRGIHGDRYTFPRKDGTNGQVITTDGAGRLTFTSPSGTGTVTSVDSGTGLTGGPITGSGTLNVDVGTTANKIVQLDGSAKLPAVDGSNLTNLPSISSLAWSAITSTPTTISGYGITDAFDGAYSSLTGTPTIPTQTVVNNNADNRLITGSGTADNLNGEADFTWDGSNALIDGSAGGVNSAVVNIKTDNSGWNRPQLMVEDSNGKVFSQVGQHSTTNDYYQWNITLDPDNTHPRTNVPGSGQVYAGDYFVDFQKNYSDQDEITINMRAFGAHNGFNIISRDDANGSYGAGGDGGATAYKHKNINLNGYETNFNCGDNGNILALTVEEDKIACKVPIAQVQLASDPSSPDNGWTYYNTTTHKLRLYANGAWVDLNQEI